jgi:phospholipid/cholesterol/gamma-HCH transport system substrate-binding protein
MINNRDGIAEIIMGGVVLVIAASFIAYSVKSLNLSREISKNNFVLYANFQSVDGIQLGSNVVLAGVKVGTVSKIELDKKSFQARASLALYEDYKLPDDTEAVISSEGLLGGNYVSLNVGGSDLPLNNGDDLLYTQSSISILNLLTKFTGQ